MKLPLIQTYLVQCADCKQPFSKALNAMRPHKSEITLLLRTNTGVDYVCRKCHKARDAAEEEQQRQRELRIRSTRSLDPSEREAANDGDSQSPSIVRDRSGPLSRSVPRGARVLYHRGRSGI